jgi:hypothetical protein
LAEQLTKGLDLMSRESSPSEKKKESPSEKKKKSPSENKKDKPTIKEIFVDNYRNKCELFEEIQDIFSKIEEMESKGKKLTLIMEKKLMDTQKALKKKDIGLNEIKKVNDDYSNLIKIILELGKKFQEGYALIKKIKSIYLNQYDKKRRKYN